MDLLLDTQTYLWFLDDSARLMQDGREAIDGASRVFVSAASVWEAAIKVRLGKLDVDLARCVGGITASGFEELPVLSAHAARVATLPRHHGDPFDRLLVAQAEATPLVLLSCDPVLAQCSPLVRIVSA